MHHEYSYNYATIYQTITSTGRVYPYMYTVYFTCIIAYKKTDNYSLLFSQDVQVQIYQFNIILL